MRFSQAGRAFCRFSAFCAAWLATFTVAAETFRPPAVPLVTCDPYFSVWSPADRLTDADTTHWTGKKQRLTSLLKIDGEPFRVLGTTPANVPSLEQKGLQVLPTRTIYTFEGHGVELTLTFMTPMLPQDISVLSRPVTYVTYDCKTSDGKPHEIWLLFTAGAELAVNTPQQRVTCGIEPMDGIAAFKIGSEEQPVLATKGDDVRIDWGYLYLAAPKIRLSGATVSARRPIEDAFLSGTALPQQLPEPGPAEGLVAALQMHMGLVMDKAPLSRWLMLAYDDVYSIQYMRKSLRPYWRRDGWQARDLLEHSASEYEQLRQRCQAFDEELMADLTKAGGRGYARLGALAFRQCFAAGKFVADANGEPLQFCKENHSNGCIGTSDVFYPMAPQFLLFGPSLAKSFIVPFMKYAASSRWKFPFAPHDLGTYPQANGQVYGGGEHTQVNQMPVEESGNLLLLMGAVAQMEGNARFASEYWPQLRRWAEYLKTKGFDPENQLCTDDFAGHLAHNVNLSAKAICALGAYAKLCALRGDAVEADNCFKLARSFAGRWVQEADEGDHFRLAFDKPGTWSQKYNLIWDRILGLNLFPRDVARKEVEYYKRQQKSFGLPLDNRQSYTKLDWILWTATLTQERSDFDALVQPVIEFINETPDRSPMTDWYFTDSGRKRRFTARPVVGGVFAQMLYDQGVWKKWAARDQTKAKNWAPIPPPPKLETIVPAADTQPAKWRFTTARPAAEWFKPGFDDSSWKKGAGGFGTQATPGAVVGTVWDTSDIWLRREIDLPSVPANELDLWLHHDEDTEIFINGIEAAHPRGYSTSYGEYALRTPSRKAFRAGKNLIAVHCHQTGGGQYIDLGLVMLKPDN